MTKTVASEFVLLLCWSDTEHGSSVPVKKRPGHRDYKAGKTLKLFVPAARVDVFWRHGHLKQLRPALHVDFILKQVVFFIVFSGVNLISTRYLTVKMVTKMVPTLIAKQPNSYRNVFQYKSAKTQTAKPWLHVA